MAFDLLPVADRDIREHPLSVRRALLEEIASTWTAPLSISPRNENPEPHRERGRRFRREHPEKVAEYKRRYRERHPERAAEQARRGSQTSRDKNALSQEQGDGVYRATSENANP